jgi:hypothetical protein
MTAASHRAPTSRRPLLVASAALAAAAVVGAVLVFTPTPELPGMVVHRLSRVLVTAGLPWPVATGIADASLNVALFVPGTFAAALLWPRIQWWQWVAVGYLVSAFIEWTQWLFLVDRTAQVTDLAANTAGAALGAGLCVALRRTRWVATADASWPPLRHPVGAVPPDTVGGDDTAPDTGRPGHGT